MGYLVCGDSLLDSCQYFKGVERKRPSYQPQYPPEHETNIAYDRYYKNLEVSGEIRDLDLAKWFFDVFARVGQSFEIIEVLENGAELGEGLLGFDVCDDRFTVSWLLWLNSCANQWEKAISSEWFPKDLEPLLELVVKFFAPRLNENGLFKSRADGLFCLKCMEVIRKSHPDLWEDHGNRMIVAGLKMIPLFSPR